MKIWWRCAKYYFFESLLIRDLQWINKNNGLNTTDYKSLVVPQLKRYTALTKTDTTRQIHRSIQIKECIYNSESKRFQFTLLPSIITLFSQFKSFIEPNNKFNSIISHTYKTIGETMKSFLRSCILLFLLLFQFFFITPLQGQTEGTQAEIRESILNSNNITSAIFNYGSVGKPNYGSNRLDFVWNKLGYMFESGPLIAGEVVNDNSITLRIVSDSYILPSQGDYSPDGMEKWGWLPRPGYAKPGQSKIATINDPDSWADEWGSVWPGENGPGQTWGLNEAYYVMDDFTNAEFPYYPFPSDLTKRGLGIKAEVRIYQPDGGMKDAIVLKYKLTNESPKALNKLYFGYFGDPHLGGANDYNDDEIDFLNETNNLGANYLHAKNTLVCWDENGIGSGSGNLPVGYLGFKFLKTPDDIDLTSVTALAYTNNLPNVPRNDEFMWELFEGGIDTSTTFFTSPGDYVIFMGTGPFSLQPGETKEVVFSIFCGWNYERILQQAVYLHFHHNWYTISSELGASGGNENYKISISPLTSGIVNGTIPITWNYQGTNQNANVFIECSSDKENTWLPVASDIPTAGNYNWNTELVRDGVNYLLRIVAYNPDQKTDYYYSVLGNRFTINNPGNAQPELQFLSSFDSLIIDHSSFNLEFTSEDADNSTLNISLEYANKKNGPFNPIITNQPFQSGANSYTVNLSEIPNSDTCYFRLTASDGFLDTVIVSPSFQVNQNKGFYNSDIFEHISGNSTAESNLQIVDVSQVKFEPYLVSFKVESNNKKVSIQNTSSGSVLVNENPLFSNISTPTFDGMKLTIKDEKTRINEVKTVFNNAVLNSTLSFQTATLGSPIIPAPEDWIIVFNSTDTLQNGQYVNPGDTVRNQLNTDPLVCPFRIQTYPGLQKANYLIKENNFLLRNNSRWDFSEPIVLRPTNTSISTTSYEIILDFNNILKPNFGDTLFIVTHKTITASDTFLFTPDDSYVLGIVDNNTPATFEVYPNYPNPFNPVTTLQFSLPKAGKVVVNVYNILGEKISSLLNEMKDAGSHKVSFDGRGFASGVYIYTIQFENHILSRKMMLLK